MGREKIPSESQQEACINLPIVQKGEDTVYVSPHPTIVKTDHKGGNGIFITVGYQDEYKWLLQIILYTLYLFLNILKCISKNIIIQILKIFKYFKPCKTFKVVADIWQI